MKNKKAIYVLIPLVIIIWGGVVYRLYYSLHPSNDLLMTSPTGDDIVTENSFQPDTFSLVNNYRDPFLGKIIHSEVKASSKSSIVNRPDKIVTPWPSIIYNGMIKNQSSKKELAMVQINGQNQLMKVKDVVLEIQLLKIYKDSIQVKYVKEKRTIKK